MSLLPRIGLLVASLLLLLVLGEIGARVWVSARDEALEPASSLAGLPEITDAMSLSRANLLGVHQGVRFRTNSHGIRGPEYAPRPAPGTFRILIGGDSVTAGWGVPEDRSYASVLERLLNESPPEQAHGVEHFEVVNTGLAGINAAFANARIEKFAEIYHPDLTVYGFTTNDIQGPHYRKLPKEEGRPDWVALWRQALRFEDSHSALLRELWPRLVMLVHWDAFHPGESESDPRSSELYQNYFENPAAWAQIESALDKHARLAARSGHCGHVFIHTFLGQLTPEHRLRPVYERVEEAARRRGLGVTQSLPYFIGRDPEKLRVSWIDVHPNAEGHAILARALYEGLLELPAECWRLDPAD